ncbi:transketolase [bacterium]|nr:transketolase [bacterium]
MEAISTGSKCKSQGFTQPAISDKEVERLSDLARQARGDIIEMTTLAGSGHPGGSLSSVDLFTTIWSYANVTPATVNSPNRDRVVVSHGHTAAGVYAALGRMGYFNPIEVIKGFRCEGSKFEGHPDLHTPGVEWVCGNLGQGLSASCGFALASRLTRTPYHVFCIMGDGEQQKGQITEARRFASKYALSNLTAVIDCNGLQAMGSVDKTMPQNLAAEWSTAGWNVAFVDGHDFRQIYEALYSAYHDDRGPTVILAHTVMGKGVSFIEDRYEFHGQPLTEPERDAALAELGLLRRQANCNSVTEPLPENAAQTIESLVRIGNPRDYDCPTDYRSAFGNALEDIAVENPNIPMAIFDCDLSASVKTQAFGKVRPEGMFQCGIQEHSTASIAGAVSKCGVLSFFADFGVFGIDETYNQHRMNDINNTSLKLICTHCGLDVGEDGKTHQCIDYTGLASNLFGWKLIVPADANQTDRVIRYIASTPGRFLVALGRSKTPVAVNENNEPLFTGTYSFEYGRADWLRHGKDGVIVTMGGMATRALAAHDQLKEQGLNVGVMNLSSPLDLDKEAIAVATQTGLLVTYEDQHIRTGIGALIGTYLAESGIHCQFKRMGVTHYGHSCSPEKNYQLQGLDVDSLVMLVVQSHSST